MTGQNGSRLPPITVHEDLTGAMGSGRSASLNNDHAFHLSSLSSGVGPGAMTPAVDAVRQQVLRVASGFWYCLMPHFPHSGPTAAAVTIAQGSRRKALAVILVEPRPSQKFA